MRVETVGVLGAFVRSERQAQGWTQAELAERVGASRDWVIRLEQGHPRLEAQRVIDVLVVLGATLEVTAAARVGPGDGAPSAPHRRDPDPFAFLSAEQ